MKVQVIHQILFDHKTQSLGLSQQKNKLLHSLEEQSIQRTKILSQLTSNKKEDDDVDLFMKSIAVTVKKLPPTMIQQAKIQILTVVHDLEMQVRTSSGSTDSPSATSSEMPLSSTSSQSVHAENISILCFKQPTIPSGPTYTIL